MSHRNEKELVLQATDKPLSHKPILDHLRARTPAGASDHVIYYVCGECGVIVGNTPELWMEPGDVIACRYSLLRCYVRRF